MKGVSLSAPAKVNLRLIVLARETTGYHSIETIFCGISLCDRLHIDLADDGLRLEVMGAVDSGPTEANLVWRAALLFCETLGVDPSVRIRLEKEIPVAAGLGGGSSDAAATLRALNLLHGMPFAEPALLELGAELGSDVPFFLGAMPFALAWNRGDRLLQLPPPPAHPIIVVDPGTRMATADAFARLTEIRLNDIAFAARPPPVSLDASKLSRWTELSAIARNDFEWVAREHVAAFDDWLALLRQGNPLIGMLSGSGSAFFGIFDSREELLRCESRFREAGLATHLATTLERWPSPQSRH